MDLIGRAITVYKGLKNNPHFPNLPFDLEELQTRTEAYSASNAAAMDGNIQARAQRDSDREVLVDNLLSLAHYVQDNCKRNEEILRSAGFEPRPGARTQTPPLGERIRSIKSGMRSGEALVRVLADPEAYSYELRVTLFDPGKEPDDWAIIPVTITRTPVLVENLTPGATYVFQVRAVYKEGYSNWTDSVTWMCS